MLPEATSARFAQVQSGCGREVAREVDHYSLDVIISIGYRVKSLRGTQLRICAAAVLLGTLLYFALRIDEDLGAVLGDG